jgi:hydrogenase large subunit
MARPKGSSARTASARSVRWWRTAGKIGAYEAALLDTPMHDPELPLEILRTIHSFDPCLACATHVLDMDGNEVTSVKVR